MVKGVANVWVPVQDIERALDSYQNTLGFQPIKRDGPWAEIDASGLNIDLNGREPEEAQAGGGPIIPSGPRAGSTRRSRTSVAKAWTFQPQSPNTNGAGWRPSRIRRATTSSSTSCRAS